MHDIERMPVYDKYGHMFSDYGSMSNQIGREWVVYQLLDKGGYTVYIGQCKGSNFPSRPYSHKFQWTHMRYWVYQNENDAVEEEARSIHGSESYTWMSGRSRKPGEHPRYNKLCPWHPRLTEEASK